MNLAAVESGTATNIATATTTAVSTKPCTVLGIFCSSSTSGTVKLQTAAAATIVNTFSVVAGTYYKLGIDCPTLSVVSTGALDIVVITSGAGVL